MMESLPNPLSWSLRRIWGRSSLLGRASLIACVLLVVTRCRQVSAASSDSDDSDGTITMSDEKRLIKKLLDNYETVGVVGRPVYNVSQTISVSYGLSLIQILDLDEKNQVLTTNVWSRYMWSDVLLRWDPKDYGGVEQVRVPSSKIWTPDIVLYNIADIRLKEQRDAMVIISSVGLVIWIPPAIFKSTCPIDITNFPFDIQVCKMKFGSWTYDGFKLDINFYEDKDYVETTEYMDSNEWSLLEHPAIKNVLHYEGFNEPYLDLTFFLKIKRVAAFYNYIVVLPCVLLSFLTLVIFWLPPESPAKVMLGMSVFVAFFVLLLLLAESIPPAATDIPLIGAYFCVNMILITLSTFLAVIIIQTHIRGDRKNKVPPWLRRVAIEGMARLLCMGEFLEKEGSTSTPAAASARASEGRHSEETSSLHQKHAASSSTATSTAAAAAASSKDKRSCRTTNTSSSEANFNRIQPSPGGARDGSTAVAPPGEYTTNAAVDPSSSMRNPILENDIKEIRRILKNYMGRLDSKDATAKTAKEWRLVARVLDRLFFFTYIATIVVSWCIFFPRDVGDIPIIELQEHLLKSTTMKPTTDASPKNV